MDDKIALYPGSFDPWHEGHQDVLDKALKIFDKVVILQGHNPAKNRIKSKEFLEVGKEYNGRVETGFFKGLLADAIENSCFDAVIRGLRSGYDLEYEINNQFWNEDLGVNIPFVYFICDRNFTHISSTAIRELRELRETKGDK